MRHLSPLNETQMKFPRIVTTPLTCGLLVMSGCEQRSVPSADVPDTSPVSASESNADLPASASKDGRVHFQYEGRPELQPLETYVSFEATQNESAAGIQLRVVRENVGSHTLQVAVDRDHCSIEVLNEAGWPVTARSLAPLALINSPETRGGANKQTQTLAPGEKFVVDYAIKEVLEKPKQPSSADPEVRIAPPAGEFKLKVRCTQIFEALGADTKASRAVATDYFKVSYGRKK